MADPSDPRRIRVLGLALSEKSWSENSVVGLSFLRTERPAWVGVVVRPIAWPAVPLTPKRLVDTLMQFARSQGVSAIGISGPQAWRSPKGTRVPGGVHALRKDWSDPIERMVRKGAGRWADNQDPTHWQRPVGTFRKVKPPLTAKYVEFCIQVWEALRHQPDTHLLNDQDRHPASDDRPRERILLLESSTKSAFRGVPRLGRVYGHIRSTSVRDVPDLFELAREAYGLPPAPLVLASDLEALGAGLPAAAVCGGPCEVPPPAGTPAFDAQASETVPAHRVEGLLWSAKPSPRPSGMARVERLTIDGIGAYRTRTTLELQALTVLCGPNGTGKSTWLSVLDYLQEAVPSEDFPFRPIVRREWLRVGRERDYDMGHLVSRDRTLEGAEKPGEIQFEFVLLADLDCGELSRPKSAPTVTPDFDAWLWRGKAPKGARFTFTVRTSYTYSRHFDAGTLRSTECAMTLHGAGTLAARLNHSGNTDSPAAKAEVTFKCPAGSDLARHSCSREAHGPVFRDPLVRALTSRLRSTLCPVVDSSFHVGSIREISAISRSAVETKISLAPNVSRRHVGVRGERTLKVLSAIGFDYTRPLEPPFAAHAKRLEFSDEQALALSRHVLFPSDCISAEEQARWLALLPEPVRDPWEELGRRILPELDHALRSRSDYGYFQPLSYSRGVKSKVANQWHESLAALLKELHGMTELAQLTRGCVRHWVEHRDLVPSPARLLSRGRGLSLSRRSELAFLLSCAGTKLEPADLRRRNELLLLDLTSIAAIHFQRSTNSLADVMDQVIGSLTRSPSRATVPGPSAVQLDPGPLDTQRRMLWPYRGSIGLGEEHQRRFSSPAFPAAERAVPLEMSTGWHHLYPIVLQATVAQPGETLVLENPEVHLHPALQVRLIEHLLEHVRAGKSILLETQSDLVVRRICRAVGAGELCAERVGVYFTELHEGSEGVAASATLTRVELTERGEPTTWPSGFLDEDVLEAERGLEQAQRRSEREASAPNPGLDRKGPSEDVRYGPGHLLKATLPDLRRPRGDLLRGRDVVFPGIPEVILILWDSKDAVMAYPMGLEARSKKALLREVAKGGPGAWSLDLRRVHRIPRDALPKLVEGEIALLKPGEFNALLTTLARSGQITEAERRDILRARNPTWFDPEERRRRCVAVQKEVVGAEREAKRHARKREWKQALQQYRIMLERAVRLAEERWTSPEQASRSDGKDLQPRLDALAAWSRGPRQDRRIPEAVQRSFRVLNHLGTYGAHDQDEEPSWLEGLVTAAGGAASVVTRWAGTTTEGRVVGGPIPPDSSGRPAARNSRLTRGLGGARTGVAGVTRHLGQQGD